MADLLAGYLACIHADFPVLHVASARLNSDGLMNDVVVIDDDLALRFAKNERAKSLLAYASRLPHVIERYVTTAVPHIVLRTDIFMHYCFLPGAPLYRHTLLRADTMNRARFLAGALELEWALAVSNPETRPCCWCILVAREIACHC